MPKLLSRQQGSKNSRFELNVTGTSTFDCLQGKVNWIAWLKRWLIAARLRVGRDIGVQDLMTTGSSEMGEEGQTV